MRKKRSVLLIVMALLLTLTVQATAAAYPTLRPNDSGEEVRRMQIALNQLGYATGGIDGKYGPATEAAVRLFQSQHGLKVDGKAGPNTLSLLYQLASQATQPTQPTQPVQPTVPSSGNITDGLILNGLLFGGNYATLEYGDRGDRVSTLQNALNQLGFSVGLVDGNFGSGTKKAVLSFQQVNGLKADGKAGQLTLKRLETVMSGQVPVYAPAATVPPTTGSFNGYTIPTRTLRSGDKGEDVRTVQRRLQELGYYAGALDGNYGSGTVAAVTLFQQRHGLVADGKAGPSTYAVLFSQSAVANGTVWNPSTPSTPVQPTTPTTTYTVPTRTLRSSDEGEDVRTVQRRLQELVYYTGTLDGKYGSGTVAAVTLFQQRNGLTADGKAGPSTYSVLFSQSAVANTTTPVTPAPNEPYTNLSVGSTGDAVTRLQTALVNLRYTLSITGVYDQTTRLAVIAFQQRNGLTADGIAGPKTQEKLYSGNCVTGDTALPTPPAGAGTSVTPPSVSQLQLLHWFRDIKPTLQSRCQFTIYDPATGLSWKLRLYSPGRHADSEPLTLTDTQIMFKAFGNQNTWNQKPVYVLLPNGAWTIAAMHNVPHLSGSIKDNGFDGHLCVHFLRDMAEAEKNDPKYGVSNQKTIRQFWKSLTGQEINY